MEMTPIARIEADLPQKFGIPRNSFLAPHLQGRIVFEPEFALPQAVAGLEEFSHLWLLWEFENGAPSGTAADIAADMAASSRANAPTDATHGAEASGGAGVAADDTQDAAISMCSTDVTPRAALAAETSAPMPGGPDGAAAKIAPTPAHSARRWIPTVRPPRLGGSERRGVFATRSPFRPNPIGLTCVKLDRIEIVDGAPVIHVLAADLRNGTPIFDIKPYIPFADCHPEASGGWIDSAPWKELEVDFPDALQARVPAPKLAGLIEVLRQDPRRAGSKHDPGRVYHLAYAGLDVAFTVDGELLRVVDIA